MNTQKEVYYLPEGISDLAELLKSEDFRKFVKENAHLKTGIKAVEAVSKLKHIEEKNEALLGENSLAQAFIIKYLKTLDKSKKRYRYVFQKVFNEATTVQAPKQIKAEPITINMKTTNQSKSNMTTLATDLALPVLSSTVHVTRDYFLFKSLDGNRNVNHLHQKRLKASMESKYLFSPIIVNENYEVIDGQHRLACCEELGLPVYYIVCEGYGLREVQILNASSKNWSADDYMQGYCDLGYKDYQTYKELKETYGFGHRETQALLEGSAVKNMQDFYLGKFKVKDKKKAVEMAERLTEIQPFFEGYKLRNFVFAMLHMFKQKNFDHDEFIQKLNLQPTALKKCATTDQYKDLIETIYNYRRRDKVSLKY